MTEVFLSYDSGDRDRARPVRDGLTAQGFDVHWDQEALPGVEWEAWVRRRVARAKCVVVLRSAASAQSNRISHVAAVAETRGKLILVRLEPRSIWQALAQGPAQSQSPGQAQAAPSEAVDLASWSGDPEHSGWQELCRRIDAKLRSSLWVQRLIHDVEAERARWHAQYEVSAARWKALNGELAHERSERGAAQDKVAGLEAQLDAGAKARLKLQTSLMELEQRLTATEAKHAEAGLLLGEEVRQKGAQLAEVETALAREQDEAMRLKSELAGSESTHRELSARIAAHESAIGERDARIVALDARIAERDAEAEGLRAAAAAREAELAGLRAALAERDAEFARLGATVTQRDADVASLRAAVVQRDADIGSLRATVQARTADVGGLTVALGQRDAEVRVLRGELAGLQTGIAERDSYMADLEASVTQRDTYIARLTASLADGRAYMADLEASIAQRDTHIADLKTNVAERDTHIANLKTGLKELERRSQGRGGAGLALATLGRATAPVVVLAGVALSLLTTRQG